MRRFFIFLLALFPLVSESCLAQPSYVSILDDYVSIDGLPRSLGVNMKFQPPKGWKEQKARRPHIVKMYKSPTTAFFSLTINDNITFISRKEFLDYYDEYSTSFIDGMKDEYSNRNFKLLSTKLITVDKYPFIAVKFMFTQTSYGQNIQIMGKSYCCCYEDKLIIFGGMASKRDFTDALEAWFDLVVCSTVFPDQYQN